MKQLVEDIAKALVDSGDAVDVKATPGEHATILELNAESYRRRSALATGAKAAAATARA